ncbi:MAG: alpha/beta hydrolase [Betaproteobacteria bacterium]|nr:alpha/beta hydrolase [Betaproteobacteria bacterium]MCC6248971.1 alpha/beta hydrolase [Rubrivivax sp.]MCL4696758.1 alpha/beta hydrolase [Burkholderiaceae bacterium]
MGPRSTPAHRALARTIVFCHANGFPGSTYGVLFEAWRAAGWRVLAPEKLGHDPHYPVTNGWRHLRDELLAFLEREAGATPERPVALVGHSMGGYMSLLAASRRPALVHHVVLLDAPIVSGWRSPAFGLLKLSGLIHRGGPGRASARRREHWPSEASMREHFTAKSLFARWDRRVLDDYLRHGFEPDPAHGGGVRLAFHRDIETRIYNTLPHEVPAMLKRHPLRCPVGFVAGRRSAENRQLGLAFAQHLAGPRWKWIDGSHLFPMERPDETAAAVRGLLAA